MEILFDNLSIYSPTTISCQQGLQFISTVYYYFCWVLQHHLELVIHLWDLGTSWSVPKIDREHKRKFLDILLNGNHLWNPSIMSKESWNPDLCQVRVLRVEDQPTIKCTHKMHTDFVFCDPHMDSKLILLHNQWLWSVVKIPLNHQEMLNNTASRFYYGTVLPYFGLWSCNRLGILWTRIGVLARPLDYICSCCRLCYSLGFAQIILFLYSFIVSLICRT